MTPARKGRSADDQFSVYNEDVQDLQRRELRVLFDIVRERNGALRRDPPDG